MEYNDSGHRIFTKNPVTTWDLWQQEVVATRRLSNALRILGIDPDSIISDEKYDNEGATHELFRNRK